MKIALLGDIALIGAYSIYNNTDMIKNGMGGVESVLSQCDFVIGNLESPFSYQKKKYGAKSAFLCSEPENIEILKMLHINAVTIANNHMFDYGVEGYELTKHLLEEAGVEWFGAEGKDYKVEFDGNRLAFTGWCCYSTNPQGCVKNGDYGLNELDVSVIEKVLCENSQNGWLNIAAIHTGIEHVNYPSLDTIRLAEKLIKTGPMVFYGHHPHVAQPIEMKGESLVAYSLGNFCFDDIYTNFQTKTPFVKLSEDNKSSFILIVTIDRNKIVGYETVPIYITKRGIEVGRGITSEILDGFLRKMRSLSEIEYENLRKQQRNAWIAPRKSQRDLRWFFKHLKPLYIRLMITNKQNSGKYNRHIFSQL